MSSNWSEAHRVADTTLSRRNLLGLAAAAPVAMLLGAGAAAQGAAPCVNPDTLPASQKNRRRSLNFVAQSPDPKKSCGKCAFFTGAAGGCGKCQMLSGGIVSAASVCDSFAPKG
ncbi:twin-arginine translocation signal domain-containing protein [Sphingomonas sp. G-3-2-10]|nr:twin-arginine translocation signal domain-containing protein [Sphingomonas sp. G-3-2-10]